MTVKVLPYLLFILFFLGCKDRIVFEIDEGESKYFIDGFISDIEKSHEFSIFRTIPLEAEQYEPDTEAEVFLIVNDVEEIPLTGGAGGVYCTPVMKAEEGKVYKIRAFVSWGIIESRNQSLPVETTIQDQGLAYRPEFKETILPSGGIKKVQGVVFSTEVQKEENSVFYQWILKEHFALLSELAPEGSPVKLCYVSNYVIRQTFLHEDIPIDGVESYTRDLMFLGFDRKFQVDFALEVTRLILNEEAYGFMEQVRNQVTNTGGLFDAAVFSIPGNYIFTNADRKVLGFFGVHRESHETIFVSQNELPYSLDVDMACFGPFSRLDGPRPYCSNCLDAPDGYEFVTNQKPTWWR